MRLPRLFAAIILSHDPLTAGIQWDTEQPVLIQEGGHYERIAGLYHRTLIDSYDFRRTSHVRTSHGDGKTWQAPVMAAKIPAGTNTNTELCLLKNGDVLSFFNFRPDINSGLPFAIVISRSSEQCLTWSKPETLYKSDLKFGDGCWEPTCIQLRDESLHLYFANEHPYQKSSEQEIELMLSFNQGATWSKVERIDFRKNHRDGMPLPVTAPDIGRIFMAIEENGLNGDFKPVIISTKIESNCWRNGTLEGNSPDLWSVLATPLRPETYAGASCLRRLPDGAFQ